MVKSFKLLADKKILIPFILITSCFAWWGLANNMTDTLLAAFKRIKSMSDLQTSFIQFAFYGSYFCFALPAALYIRKYSYKSGLLLGLGLFILGGALFYPASITQQYGHFLVALYILAGGLSILETSANPYILKLGSPETATQRLNLAQSFNPIGSILGVVISKVFILSELQQISKEERVLMDPEQLLSMQTQEINAVMGPYVVVSVLLFAVFLAIFFVKMPRIKDDSTASLSRIFGKLLRNRNYLLGVVAQFFYVGAQIGVWSFTIRYVMQELSVTEDQAANYYLAALVLFTISRFVCTWLMTMISPEKLLGILAASAGMLTLITMLVGGIPGIIALVGISACMSLMFPTIYGIGLHGLEGEEAKIGGSGLIMAILGGAIITGVQGAISDATTINFSYVVPFICFLVVAYFGFSNVGKNGAI